MARVLLFGLDQTVADELSNALRQVGEFVQTATQDSGVFQQGSFELVFAAASDLTSVQANCPGVPVVVVSRLPEVSAWLDALEKGAADYCGAPFEARQVRWLMHSTLAQAHRRVA
jgi:DNA-binding NtrC family response regulator